MSTGPRITITDALVAAKVLIDSWTGIELVGSARRRQHDPAASVGDLEFVARMPSSIADGKWRAEDDPLFRAINANMANPWAAPRSLFDPTPDGPAGEVIGSAVRGLCPGFKALSMEITPWKDTTIPCQVYRYDDTNRGWITVMRTGPMEFGKMFLGKWKERWGIASDKQASIDGHLVNGRGEVVEVRDEDEAFLKCGMPNVDPQLRESYVDRLQGGLRIGGVR